MNVTIAIVHFNQNHFDGLVPLIWTPSGGVVLETAGRHTASTIAEEVNLWASDCGLESCLYPRTYSQAGGYAFKLAIEVPLVSTIPMSGSWQPAYRFIVPNADRIYSPRQIALGVAAIPMLLNRGTWFDQFVMPRD